MSIRRDKSTMFLDMPETTTVMQLKKVVQGIIKRTPEEFILFDLDANRMLEDKLQLADQGLTQSSAKAQNPAQIKLVYKDSDGQMEQLDICEYSAPPELPDVMKSHEGSDEPEAQYSTTA